VGGDRIGSSRQEDHGSTPGGDCNVARAEEMGGSRSAPRGLQLSCWQQQG